jgi:hypothetical protein
VSSLITRYAIFEGLYLRPTVAVAAAVKEQLSRSIVELYASVLKYLSKARRYYDRSTLRTSLCSISATLSLVAY